MGQLEQWYVVHLPNGDFEVVNRKPLRVCTTCTGPFITHDNAYEWAERLTRREKWHLLLQYVLAVAFIAAGTYALLAST